MSITCFTVVNLVYLETGIIARQMDRMSAILKIQYNYLHSDEPQKQNSIELLYGQLVEICTMDLTSSQYKCHYKGPPEPNVNKGLFFTSLCFKSE